MQIARVLLVLFVALLFVAFVALASRGQLGAAAVCLVAGFLFGACLTGWPTEAEREAARQQHAAEHHSRPRLN